MRRGRAGSPPKTLVRSTATGASGQLRHFIRKRDLFDVTFATGFGDFHAERKCNVLFQIVFQDKFLSRKQLLQHVFIQMEKPGQVRLGLMQVIFAREDAFEQHAIKLSISHYEGDLEHRIPTRGNYTIG